MFFSWWFAAVVLVLCGCCRLCGSGVFKPSDIITWHEQRSPYRRLLLQDVLVDDIQVPPQHGVDAPAAPAAILAAPVLPPFLAHGGGLRKETRVTEVAFSAHDAVGARGLQALL